ncbi:hypothetical protein ACFRLW_40705, partial [Streptomyces sp. NPDC056728]
AAQGSVEKARILGLQPEVQVDDTSVARRWQSVPGAATCGTVQEPQSVVWCGRPGWGKLAAGDNHRAKETAG